MTRTDVVWTKHATEIRQATLRPCPFCGVAIHRGSLKSDTQRLEWNEPPVVGEVKEKAGTHFSVSGQRNLAGPIRPQTLATLTVSRRPGYGGVATVQSVATFSQLAPMRLVKRDYHSTTGSASCHLSNQLPRRRTVGTLIARWQNGNQRWYRSWSVAACVRNGTFRGELQRQVMNTAMRQTRVFEAWQQALVYM